MDGDKDLDLLIAGHNPAKHRVVRKPAQHPIEDRIVINTSRRNFLRGLGVSIALPAFHSLRAADNTRSNGNARRFVCVSPSYGMHPDGFFPEKTGADYETPTLLKSLEPHRADLTIFTNLDHPGVGGGHGCSQTFLNGVEMKDVKDSKGNFHDLTKDPLQRREVSPLDKIAPGRRQRLEMILKRFPKDGPAPFRANAARYRHGTE